VFFNSIAHLLQIMTSHHVCGDGKHLHRNNLHRVIVKAGYAWKGMTKDISNFVKQCNHCQEETPSPLKPPLRPILTKKPRERFQMDVTYAVKDKHYVYVMIDCFTKRIWAMHSRRRNADATITFLNQVGEIPEILHTDNGGEFVNEKVEKWCKDRKVKIKHGRPYHPQSQGQVERVNKTLKISLQKHGGATWWL
jgi:transposase InsO family protein